jgi:hypothetical protein
MGSLQKDPKFYDIDKYTKVYGGVVVEVMQT